ncbi:MAG: MmcQ/YjbR family DNA-binding protein [Deltaproteobacteria bacterium]|nr:MmcQ/YjbR family DNA-binding protein [Deltaproteobacteria bacterium]
MSEKGFARVRKVGLSLPGVTEQIQWVDHLLLKVGGKMFVVLSTTDASMPGSHVMSIKCSDDDFDRLTALPGMVPAPYLARAKWVAFESFDAIPFGELDGLVSRAYELVAAKLPAKVRQALGVAKASAPSAIEQSEDEVPSMMDLMREEGLAAKRASTADKAAQKKRPVAKKAAPKKAAPKKAAPKKAAPKKAAPKKAAPKKAAPKKAAPKKAAPKRAAPKKAAPKKR